MPIVRELQVTYKEIEVNDPRVGDPVRNVDAVLRVMGFLRHAVDEEVWAIVLDGHATMIGMAQVAKGGRHETTIDPASLFRTALLSDGHAVILVHNHPSGAVRPSQADLNSTERLLLAGFALELPVVDHVIITRKDAYSFARSGMLGFLQARQLKALGLEGIPDVRHPDDLANEARHAIQKLGVKQTEPGEAA
jgi:DNA repair protein RadC